MHDPFAARIGVEPCKIHRGQILAAEIQVGLENSRLDIDPVLISRICLLMAL
jgi:hypothetical protein